MMIECCGAVGVLWSGLTLLKYATQLQKVGVASLLVVKWRLVTQSSYVLLVIDLQALLPHHDNESPGWWTGTLVKSKGEVSH